MRRPSRMVIAVAALVGALGLAITVADGDGGDRIPEGVTVDGVDVGGLEVEVARGALRRHARTTMARGVVVRAADDPERVVRLDRAVLRPTPLVDEAIAEARRPPAGLARLRGLVGADPDRAVPLRYRFPPGRLDAAVARTIARVGRPARAATVRLRGERLEVVAGTPGIGISAEDLAERLSTLPAEVVVPREVVPPPVSTEEARAARREAEALLADPPVVVDGDTRARLQPQTLRSALRFRPGDDGLEVALDPAAIGPEVRSVFGDRERPPRDAAFVVRGERVTVADERAGSRIDMAVLARAAARPGATVRLPLRRLAPGRPAGPLRDLGVDAVVADYTSPYPCCEPRVTNIRRAAALLDGRVIAPGERFSLNQAIGERTAARGFVEAPVVADGRFETGIGGGVSQMATALYNAAFFAGLELIAHTPHEVYISRYPPGREATISWGGPDLVFRNDWDAPVVLDVTAGDTAVRVRMFSRRLDRRVETETGEPTDYREPEIIRTPDPTLEPGTEVVDQQLGGAGFTVRYTRRVYRGAERVRDETYVWTYRPVDARVRVGPEEERTATETTGPGGGTTTEDAPPEPAPSPAATAPRAPVTGPQPPG